MFRDFVEHLKNIACRGDWKIFWCKMKDPFGFDYTRYAGTIIYSLNLKLFEINILIL